MKKVLLPIDGSIRSLRTIDMVKQTYSPDEVEITILTVLAGQMHVDAHFEIQRMDRKARGELETFAGLLKGYNVKTALLWGNPGPEIVQFAREGQFDTIMMTRSSRGPLQRLGSVAIHIVRNAPFLDLMIMHEEKK